MDNHLLKKAIQALKWEARYRERYNLEKSKDNFFLASLKSLDADFERHLDLLNITNGHILDIGTGTGEQAVFLAKKGYRVTAIDVSSTAIKKAAELAIFHTADVRFLEENILFSTLTDQFDLITDRGCFTLIPQIYRKEYVLKVKKLLKLNGWLFIKSDKKKNNLFDLFINDTDFKVYALEESNYISLNDKVLPANFLVIQKII